MKTSKYVQWFFNALSSIRNAPVWMKVLMCMGAVAYLFSPIDVIPDFLFPIGFFDDLVVIAGSFGSLFFKAEAPNDNEDSSNVIDVES